MQYENKFTVLPKWIDHNGHMNVAYYVVAFDLATDLVYDDWGLGDDYPETGNSVYTLAMNVDYLSELVAGDPIMIRTLLLDHDHKRVHYVHEMYHSETGVLSATNECLATNVDLSVKRSAPFPELVLARLGEVLAAHSSIGKPTQIGRKLGIRRK